MTAICNIKHKCVCVCVCFIKCFSQVGCLLCGNQRRRSRSLRLPDNPTLQTSLRLDPELVLYCCIVGAVTRWPAWCRTCRRSQIYSLKTDTPPPPLPSDSSLSSSSLLFLPYSSRSSSCSSASSSLLSHPSGWVCRVPRSPLPHWPEGWCGCLRRG